MSTSILLAREAWTTLERSASFWISRPPDFVPDAVVAVTDASNSNGGDDNDDDDLILEAEPTEGRPVSEPVVATTNLPVDLPETDAGEEMLELSRTSARLQELGRELQDAQQAAADLTEKAAPATERPPATRLNLQNLLRMLSKILSQDCKTALVHLMYESRRKTQSSSGVHSEAIKGVKPSLQQHLWALEGRVITLLPYAKTDPYDRQDIRHSGRGYQYCATNGADQQYKPTHRQ